MNLNKLNKDQLINKIKDQENVMSSNSFWSQIIQIIKHFRNLILGLKGLFMKITLLSLIIKYFRKYKFIRKILLFFNWIILSLFGISIIDIYDSNLVLYLIESIRSTHLYKVLIEIIENKVEKIENKMENIEDKVKIIENKVEKNSEFQSNMRKNNSTTTGNQTSIKENQNNFGWFNKQEIINDYKNYIFLLSLLGLLGLSWFFWDDIKPFLTTKKPDSGGNSDIINNNPDIKDYPIEYAEYFKEIEVSQELYDLEVIKSENKGKSVDYSEVEIEKWNDSPTTPKPSFSKLQSDQSVMIPITKED